MITNCADIHGQCIFKRPTCVCHGGRFAIYTSGFSNSLPSLDYLLPWSLASDPCFRARSR